MEAASQPPRQKIPKDGLGPRGVPDCYYTSRVLNSTFRYVRFVKRLRAEEEEQRKGAAARLKELQDKQYSDFFIRCDRRSLINDVARRVDLCLASYQEDLKVKRRKLMDLLAVEEETNIRKLVEQAQSGAEMIWQDKKDRLAYLLEKRKKEHEEKYKDTPLSKCAHVLPCIYKIRAKEAEQVQLYQMREKQARKAAELEMDRMWNAVAMKEADALAARMERDAIERYRRDIECKKHSDQQMEQLRLKREHDKEVLRQETLWFRSIGDAENKKEEEAERQRQEKSKALAREMDEMMEQRRQAVAKRDAEQKLIADTWDSLTGQGLRDIEAHLALRRRKKQELDACNGKMIQLKQELAALESANDGHLQEEARRRQRMVDEKRCEYLTWSQKTNRDVRKAMVDQIKDRQAARQVLQQKLAEQDEYHNQLHRQLQQLLANDQLVMAAARKKHQTQLVQQIEYNNMLKDRAKQEELDQIKKCKIATDEYQEDIKRMLCRPFYSDEVHPFMKQMAQGLQMRDKCPCSKPDYCAEPSK